MSRAFTKEDDAGDDLPERPVPPGPNYVTPRGLELLKSAAEDLIARRKKAIAAVTGAAGTIGTAPDQAAALKSIDRDLRYLEERISGATVVPRGKGPEARFGARVTLRDLSGASKTFQIVGEDEARTDSTAFIPWSAPLAQSMLGAKTGDRITWQSPDGPIQYEVAAVDYP